MFKIMTPHREDLFLVFLPAFPSGNRCAAALECAPSSERKGGRKEGRRREGAWEALAPPVGVFWRQGLVLEAALQ